MKIWNLTEYSEEYTCNVYLITGSSGYKRSMNTLIDAGRDPLVIDRARWILSSEGCGGLKRVILTHGHYDHTSVLPQIKKELTPRVYAYSSIEVGGVDHFLDNGETLLLGDKIFEVIRAYNHSDDSIYLFSRETGVLFSGDVSCVVRAPIGGYDERFLNILKRLNELDIKAIYRGHGEPINGDSNRLISMTLKNVEMAVNAGK